MFVSWLHLTYFLCDAFDYLRCRKKREENSKKTKRKGYFKWVDPPCWNLVFQWLLQYLASPCPPFSTGDFFNNYVATKWWGFTFLSPWFFPTSTSHKTKIHLGNFPMIVRWWVLWKKMEPLRKWQLPLKTTVALMRPRILSEISRSAVCCAN